MQKLHTCPAALRRVQFRRREKGIDAALPQCTGGGLHDEKTCKWKKTLENPLLAQAQTQHRVRTHSPAMEATRAPDYAILKTEWPRSEDQQRAVLAGIQTRSWTVSLDLDMIIMAHGYAFVQDLVINTSFGRRCFHVWQHPRKHQIIVVKEPGPRTPLTITCSLAAAGPNSIHAVFHCMSGRAFGSYTFTGISIRCPLFIRDLREEAEDQAANQGLLETTRQNVKLLLTGIMKHFPDNLPVWPRTAITAEALEAQLAHLQSLPSQELASLVETFEEPLGQSPTTSETASTASTASGDNNVATAFEAPTPPQSPTLQTAGAGANTAEQNSAR